jgi:FkbM family methyltransferase
MTSRPNLIYDVGVCNGDDSAYYLHKGYRVVGIEASPLLLEPLRKRFEGAIGDGRYQLLPVGIAETAGEAPFWVCDDRPEWSSFDRSIASRKGFRHHCVQVETRPFEWMLETYGTPFY